MAKSGRKRDNGPSAPDPPSESQLALPLKLAKWLIGEAVVAVPAVRYAVGVGGIAAVFAIVFAIFAGLKVSFDIALFGIIVFLGLMVVLVLFAKIATAAPGFFHGPMIVLTWACTTLVVAAMTLLFASYFFEWPLRLRPSAHPAAVSSTSGNAVVHDGNTDFEHSGFSFTRNSLVPWNSPDGDIRAMRDKQKDKLAIFFLPYDAPPYAQPADAGARSGIYSLGSVPLDTPSLCPTSGYSYHWIAPKQGETYCVRTRSGQNFAKIQVLSVFEDRISFDWVLLK